MENEEKINESVKDETVSNENKPEEKKEDNIPDGFCELNISISSEENFGTVTFQGIELVGVKSDLPHKHVVVIPCDAGLPSDVVAHPINDKFYLDGWALNGDNLNLIKGETLPRNNERIMEAIKNNKKVEICAKFHGRRMLFYVVNTYKKKEKKVKDALVQVKKNYDDIGKYTIGRKLVAVNQVPVKDRKTKLDIPGKFKDEYLYPGYLFVEMDMDDGTWFDVRNTSDVTGISGSGGGGQKPTPVSAEEMEPVLKRLGLAEKSMFESYHVGDVVKIINGSLAGTEGVIKNIDTNSLMYQIEIVFFGRTTEVSLGFQEIEKK